ncbi:PREDICTED: PWWP domain-containing protein MUM1 [Chaetura pelagica]|uniref:PWWP domain-containing protein MUM1 n=1 Tax=Chaetura pelagica TaxID=8897 RepID=UPI000523940F|nr:PREDICTED: PWWP domain-containing protein MUM1 [Chaetura pelagica]
MTEQEFVLCMWQERLWPAKGQYQGNHSRGAVEELKYCHSLKIALDILSQDGSAGQGPPAEGANPPLSQENKAGSVSSTLSHRSHQLPQPKEKLGSEASRGKRRQKNNLSLKSDGKRQKEKGSFLPKNTKGHTAAPARGAPTRSPPRRTGPGRKLPDSSCEIASGDLEKGLSTETEGVGEQLEGEQPRCLKQVNGEQESGAGVSSDKKRNSRNCPQSSSGPSNLGACSRSVPAQPEEEENKSLSPVVLSKVKQFQLPDFEEDEGLEPSALSSEIVSSESLSRLSPLVDEEEEEEELPSILSVQEPESIEEGILVWCKMGRYPYWPAVVKTVRRKLRRASVLLIEGDASTKKKGFSVSLKNLKHFDCEEKQDLIEQAREGYRQEIEWCIRLIADYRIRVGCHSFTGSFLEYFAADISYPVRKEGYQGPAQVTFPSAAEEDHKEPPEASPEKPSKKLLPDRTRAARDRANQKIVEFIVKTKGAEEHLLAILKSRKQSRWLKEFLNSRHYVTCIETYLEDEEQLDLVVNYLKEVYREMDTKGLHQIKGDGIKFISDVLLPEAIIYAISAVDDIDYKKAEEKYIKGPSVSKREREIFDEEILGRKKQKIKPEAATST